LFQTRQDKDETFLLALSPNGPPHFEAENYKKAKFSQIRQDLTKKLFNIYCRRCFDDKVNDWNKRLRSTAGRCRCQSNGNAKVELSIKVCDTPERLRDTLLHEMCHAAVWVIDNIRKGGHGPAWKYWVNRCQKVFPSLPLIKRCHTYKINAKYLYICNGCGIKRHSKSLDISHKICGICNGRFTLHRHDGKKPSDKATSAFAQFVKEKYKEERKPGVKHAETMKILSQRFKQVNFLYLEKM
uniref:SprT-like domain-containing protein n=1 Tax=Thelazia callipaeda TaxID=103827 RepID=A0A0N5CJR3_THECL